MMDLAPFLKQQRRNDLYRQRRVMTSPQGPRVEVDGREYVSFCSNDYLGLANHPQVKQAFNEAVERYGVGSGASHLITGHLQPHHELENELADFVGRPRALLFSTGYMANLGTVAALITRSDAVFEDRLNHASLVDAGLACGADFKRYPHADIDALQGLLSAAERSPRVRNKLVLTDGVFSMDGDIAPLPAIATLCRAHNATLMVDDAHGLGVLGETAGGSLQYSGLGIEDVPVLMGTLGKAFGSFGAFVAGSDELIETLIQKARTYIYTTALPPAVAEACRASLRLIRTDNKLRTKLMARVQQFRDGADALDLPLMPSQTPIQPLLVGARDDAADDNSSLALRLSEQLQQRGILIPAIRPPSVPKGSARLRITLSAAHNEDQVQQLLEALAQLKGQLCRHAPGTRQGPGQCR